MITIILRNINNNYHHHHHLLAGAVPRKEPRLLHSSRHIIKPRQPLIHEIDPRDLRYPPAQGNESFSRHKNLIESLKLLKRT
jgi:hypothetical protein